MTNEELNGQIEWFVLLLEQLDMGDMEAVRAAIVSALKMYRREQPQNSEGMRVSQRYQWR